MVSDDLPVAGYTPAERNRPRSASRSRVKPHRIDDESTLWHTADSERRTMFVFANRPAALSQAADEHERQAQSLAPSRGAQADAVHTIELPEDETAADWIRRILGVAANGLNSCRRANTHQPRALHESASPRLHRMDNGAKFAITIGGQASKVAGHTPTSRWTLGC